MRRLLIFAVAIGLLAGCTGGDAGKDGSPWTIDEDTGNKADTFLDSDLPPDTTPPPDTELPPDTGTPSDTGTPPDTTPPPDTRPDTSPPDAGQCPDPDDPKVEYASQDPDECKSILVGCEEGEEPFNNECGCGCRVTDTCAGQDATAEGACRALIGVKFDGRRCGQMSGCECKGSDCDALYDTTWQCAADNASCLEYAPCAPHPRTDDSNSGDGGGSCRIKYAWNGRNCKALCGQCGDDQICHGLYNTEDQCQKAHSHCKKPPNCRPMSARGKGRCDAILGYKYNGDQCVVVGGCSCEGTDCDRLYMSREQCIDETDHCE